jgi:hypothetical protein
LAHSLTHSFLRQHLLHIWTVPVQPPAAPATPTTRSKILETSTYVLASTLHLCFWQISVHFDQNFIKILSLKRECCKNFRKKSKNKKFPPFLCLATLTNSSKILGTSTFVLASTKHFLLLANLCTFLFPFIQIFLSFLGECCQNFS